MLIYLLQMRPVKGHLHQYTFGRCLFFFLVSMKQSRHAGEYFQQDFLS